MHTEQINKTLIYNDLLPIQGRNPLQLHTERSQLVTITPDSFGRLEHDMDFNRGRHTPNPD